MGKNVFGVLNKMLAVILALLGVQSCSHGGDEYGCPTATYIFRGTVTDGEGNALPEVKVSSLVKNNGGEIIVNRDSLTSTNADGKYSVVLDGYYDGGLRFTDKGGASVDTFWNSANLAPFKGGDGEWNDGVSENTMNIQLKK